mgnify:CR=1 FL=1
MISQIRKRYIYVISIVIFYFCAKLIPGRLNSFPSCPFYAITGLPCPGCGSTRATIYLIHGKWLEALYYNFFAILIDLWVIIYLIWYSVDAIRDVDTVNLLLKKKWKRKYFVIALLVIIINWGFKIHKHSY